MTRSIPMLRLATVCTTLLVGVAPLACKRESTVQTTTATGSVEASSPAAAAVSQGSGTQTASADLSDAAKAAHASQGDATRAGFRR